MGLVVGGIPHLYYSQKTEQESSIKAADTIPQSAEDITDSQSQLQRGHWTRGGEGKKGEILCVSAHAWEGEIREEKKTNNVLQNTTGIIRHLLLQYDTS